MPTGSTTRPQQSALRRSQSFSILFYHILAIFVGHSLLAAAAAAVIIILGALKQKEEVQAAAAAANKEELKRQAARLRKRKSREKLRLLVQAGNEEAKLKLARRRSYDKIYRRHARIQQVFKRKLAVLRKHVDQNTFEVMKRTKSLNVNFARKIKALRKEMEELRKDNADLRRKVQHTLKVHEAVLYFG